MRLPVRLLPLAATLGACSAAFAHPDPAPHGHGGLLAGLLHVLTEPDHLAALAIVLALAGAAAWRRLAGRRGRGGRRGDSA